MSQNHATFIQSHILRRFNVLKKIGSGAYGHVWKVQQKSTKRIFALKKIFDAFQHATDAQRTYRQIQILKQLDHPNIIKLYDTIRADNNKDVYLLFEFMEADLHNVISQGILKDVHIRFIIYQLAKALKYMHSGSIIHRDLKPSNILVNSNCSIKLCDFGLVRSLVPNNQNVAVLTQGVATRWYRAPQVLLGSKSYSTPADIWSFGCIIYQILAQKPLFPGNSTIDQIQKICTFTGYPTQEDISSLESQVSKSMIKQVKISSNGKPINFLKEFSLPFQDLLGKIIIFNPNKRLKIDQILSHQVVKAFHKPEEQVTCDKVVSTSVDDNKKFAVDQYRKLVYGVSGTKPKALSASLGSGSTSAKYLPTSNKSTLVQSSAGSTSQGQSKTQVIQRPELSKKYSHQKLRTNTVVQPTYTKVSEPMDPKKYEKPVLKYVRSAKDISRTVEGSSQNPYRKYNQPKIQTQATKQQLDYTSKGSQQITKTSSQSAYISTKNFYSTKTYLDNRASQTKQGAETTTGSNWKSQKPTITTAVLQKDMRDKAALIKSPKYISINKSDTMFKANTMYSNKYDNEKDG